jgi:hypothetical protein
MLKELSDDTEMDINKILVSLGFFGCEKIGHNKDIGSSTNVHVQKNSYELT